MVYIRMEIQNVESGEKKTIESKGKKETWVLMKFMAKAGRYANPKWKILRIETDSLMVYSYVKEHKPELPIEAVADEQ